MAVQKGPQCPYCGAQTAPGRLSCPSCGRPFNAGKDAEVVDGILSDISDLINDLDGGDEKPAEAKRAQVPSPPKKEKVAADECYQCLICGSSIPAEADKCRVCGTIFVDEAEAGDYRGLPVARISRYSEIEPDGGDIGQSRRGEEIKVEPPSPPRPGGPAFLLRREDLPVAELGTGQTAGRADELPPMEYEAHKRAAVRKKIVKRK